MEAIKHNPDLLPLIVLLPSFCDKFNNKASKLFRLMGCMQ